MLGFFLALVVENSEVYENVQKELDSVVGQRPITADDISRLPYIKACLREALRLYPPVWAFSLTPKGDELTDGLAILGGEWPIKSQQPVFIVLPSVHRDTDAWGPDVDEFRPERMLDENFKKLPPGCYKPFGNGQRACIGRKEPGSCPCYDPRRADVEVLQAWNSQCKSQYWLRLCSFRSSILNSPTRNTSLRLSKP